MKGIDHIVWWTPELATGVDRIEKLLGARAAPGGRHPAWGTHNALVSLGGTTYLEIVAPDPIAAPPGRGYVFDTGSSGDRLVTWALRREDIDTAARSVPGLGPVQAGSRKRADGTLLTWRLTDPFAMPLDGAIPFLIAWGQTPHPAEGAPAAGPLVDFRIEHPEAERVRDRLRRLECDATVVEAGSFRIVATIRTARGEVELA